MALKSTIYKINLNVSDMDRGYYAEHALTVARHPSENDERLMVRVLAFALHASEDLRFGRGLSTEDEADLYEPDLTGAIRLWLDVGLPDERLVLQHRGGGCHTGRKWLLRHDQPRFRNRDRVLSAPVRRRTL